MDGIPRSIQNSRIGDWFPPFEDDPVWKVSFLSLNARGSMLKTLFLLASFAFNIVTLHEIIMPTECFKSFIQQTIFLLRIKRVLYLMLRRSKCFLWATSIRTYPGICITQQLCFQSVNSYWLSSAAAPSPAFSVLLHFPPRSTESVPPGPTALTLLAWFDSFILEYSCNRKYIQCTSVYP